MVSVKYKHLYLRFTWYLYGDINLFGIIDMDIKPFNTAMICLRKSGAPVGTRINIIR